MTKAARKGTAPERQSLSPDLLACIHAAQQGDRTALATLMGTHRTLALIIHAQSGNADALDTLISENDGLCRHWVMKLARGAEDEESVLQVARLGLWWSIRKFDVTSGNELSTYATWWIRQRITRMLYSETQLGIYIPCFVGLKRQKVRKAISTLLSACTKPTDEAVASLCHLTSDAVHTIRLVSGTPMLLDAPAFDENDSVTLADTLPAPQPYVSSLGNFADADALHEVLTSVLWVREQQVISLRYGLGTFGYPHTLEECGKVIGVTRERIRQIEVAALRKLRVALTQPMSQREQDDSGASA